MTNRQFKVFVAVLFTGAIVGGYAFGDEPTQERAQYAFLRTRAVACMNARGLEASVALLPETPTEVALASLTELAVRKNAECEAAPSTAAVPLVTANPYEQAQPPAKQEARRRRRSRGIAYASAPVGPEPLVALSGRIGGFPGGSVVVVANSYATTRDPRSHQLVPNCDLEVRVDGHPVVFSADNGPTASLIPPGEEVEIALPFTGEPEHQVDYWCYERVCGLDGGTLVCDAAPAPTLAGRQFVRAGTRLEPGTVGSSWNRPVSRIARR